MGSGSIRETRRDPSANTFPQDHREILNRDTFLLHRIAITQSDCIAQRRIFFAERLEVNGHTERRADFILPTISPTNRATLVVKHSHMWLQKRDDLLSFYDERLLVLKQRKDRALNRRHSRMKTQDDARFQFAFVVRRLVFGVGVANQRQDSSIHASAWL